MKKVHWLLAALVAFTLSACAPAADWLRDQLDSGEGATLTLVDGGGVFDPGQAAAHEVHVTFRSRESDLALTGDHAECEVTPDGRYLDCDYALVTGPLLIEFTGSGVIGSATYVRTPGSLNWLWAYTDIE